MYNKHNYTKAGHYFSAVNVSHVLKDKEGSLWIATLNDGVMYIPNMHVNFLKSSRPRLNYLANPASSGFLPRSTSN